MFKIVVLISGRGSNLNALMDALAASKLQAKIVGVISDKADAAGIELARSNNIETKIVERKKQERSLLEFFKELIDATAAFNPDLIILAGFMRIIPDEMIHLFEGKMINIHPSLLPAFPGLRAQKQALDAGVKFAGCTVHYVDSTLDGGAIIGQAVVPVLANDDEESLSSRILKEEHKLLPAVVKAIIEGRVTLSNGRVTVRGEREDSNKIYQRSLA